jgi:serine/threonine-protein kinase
MRNAPYQPVPERETTEALTFGRYALTRKLSQGGMAEIYLARQSGIENFEKQVVVKIVLPQLSEDDSYEDMLLNEARMAARLNHPNVVQILDLGKLDGRFFIAMEYLEGENLLSIIQRSIRSGYALPVGFVCRVIADVLGGLDYAHSQVGPDGRSLGIIHRDISPPNVIVTYAGTTKLVDFGIAKATHSVSTEVTSAGQFKGKLSYMSPEQVRRQPLDARTDVFSTGVLLWELVTRKRLFRRTGDLETVRAVLEHEVPPASSINPDCPPELDQIIARALQRPVHGRYPTARAMRKALEELIRQQAWPSDSLTTQRVMSDLFGDQPRAATATSAAEEPTARPIGLVGPAAPGDSTIENDPTQRTPKAVILPEEPAAKKPDRPSSIEVTAAFTTERTPKPMPALPSSAPEAPARPANPPPRPTMRVGAHTIDYMMRMRRRWRITLSAVVGLSIFGAGVLTSSLLRRQHAPSTTLVAAAITAPAVAPGADEPAPAPAARAVAATTAAPAAAAAPAVAHVEIRVDAKSLLTLDGESIEAGVPVEVDPAKPHVVSVQRVGHHTVRTLDLPPVTPGQHLVVGLWLRGLPEAASHANTVESAPAAGEPGASTARGPVVEAIMH